MNDPLQIYLHDHLAGSSFAVELLESLCSQKSDSELAKFATVLLAEVQADVGVLEAIIERVGASHSPIKQAVAWLAEKASRLKLQDDNPKGLGTFEALETLSLGILGKLALWRALSVVAEVDRRVPEIDFGKLAASAQAQFNRVEEYRIQAARTAFMPS